MTSRPKATLFNPYRYSSNTLGIKQQQSFEVTESDVLSSSPDKSQFKSEIIAQEFTPTRLNLSKVHTIPTITTKKSTIFAMDNETKQNTQISFPRL